MDYRISKKRRTVKPEVSALLEQYPHDLQLYKVPPTGQITLVEFQDLALERQKVLQLLEVTLVQKFESQDALKQAFTNALKKDGYHYYAKLLNSTGYGTHTGEELEKELEARRRDHISHFVLRLAYSSKDDLQTYFLTQETEFFKLRFSSLKSDGLTNFLTTSGIHYSQISQEFKDENRDNLIASTARDVDVENVEFYELPFDEVIDLISDRKVYVHKGVAYVPQTELGTVFVTHFRSNLAIELNRAKQFVMRNLDDERLQSFLKSLPECYAGMGKVVWNTENTPISKLNDLSKTSYPLCMRIMHEHLTTNHHLKNTGRLQYGLFLKGIGVTLDDSIEFWRSELTKKENMNEDKFNKEYLYQIKYNYGKVGRRVDYKPLGCSKLISEQVGPGEVHGCPYRHMDSDELAKKLVEYKLPVADIKEITRLSSENHYHLACTKYFESTHKQFPGRMFLHPNNYYQESRAIINKDNVKEEENIVQDVYMPLSPEKISQPIKVKVENNLDTSNSVTPSRRIEKKVRTADNKDKMDPTNIAALLNDDSD